MQPPETIDSFETAGGVKLTLLRRGADYFIDLDDQELMSTRRTGSEVALAELGCGGLSDLARPRVLIGGLGLGFTLRAALRRLPSRASVVVAELFPEIVEWNRTHLAHLQEGALEDRRTRIAVRDVWDVAVEGHWNAILLDTDNGPLSWCLEENNRLYGREGLERLHQSLVPGGTLAIWSTDLDSAFEKRLRKTGYEARSEIVRAHAGKGTRYAIFVARRPGRRRAKAR